MKFLTECFLFWMKLWDENEMKWTFLLKRKLAFLSIFLNYIFISKTLKLMKNLSILSNVFLLRKNFKYSVIPSMLSNILKDYSKALIFEAKIQSILIIWRFQWRILSLDLNSIFRLMGIISNFKIKNFESFSFRWLSSEMQ